MPNPSFAFAVLPSDKKNVVSEMSVGLRNMCCVLLRVAPESQVRMCFRFRRVPTHFMARCTSRTTSGSTSPCGPQGACHSRIPVGVAVASTLPLP